MKILNVSTEDFEFKKLGLSGETISFDKLKEKVSINRAKETLLECNKIAERTGLSKMSLEDINAEIRAVRNAKSKQL